MNEVGAERIDTEPRSGGVLLATGVSRWYLAGNDQPHSGGSLKLSRLRRLSFGSLFSTGSRRWLEECRRYAALYKERPKLGEYLSGIAFLKRVSAGHTFSRDVCAAFPPDVEHFV